tara:strand:+ start:863 stop:2491 length:1629 start_codon:yes stop_codon:yes gene_type:complete
MKFKYKTQFLNEVQASAENVKDGKFVSQASLEQLKDLVPGDIDFEKNIDLIGVAFNAAVINQFNKNHDGIDTKTALAIKDYFIHKPTNIEHNKKKIVGHIVSSGFSRMYNDELISSVGEGIDQPFNLALGAVVYSAANKEFAEMVLRSVDPEDEMHQVVSASWELGFNEYVIAAGSRSLDEAEIISDPKHVEELSQYLKAFDGEGKLNDGTEVYRLVVGDVYPLGIGFTANPAADVKGIYVFDDKKKEESENDSLKAEEKIKVDNKIYFSKSEKNISQNGILTVNESINNISIMEKQELLEDFKAILEEKMPGHDFSQETVANVGRVIGDAIRSKSEQYEKELLALEEERQKFAEAEEGIKADLEDLKSKLEAAEGQVATLGQEIESRKSEDAFNARMEDVDATYELSEEDRKVLASEVEAIDLDEASFEEYKSKLSVMWAHKSKEYLAEQEKAFEEKLEAELQKRLQSMDTSEASDASEESETEESEASEVSEEVEEVLENAETEEEEVIANNNTASAVEEVSLKEKFAQAFAKENISIKF